VSERLGRIRAAYLRLDEGIVADYETLFADDAHWLGIPGTGFEGDTPT
jgi:hypothetical protein